jgi:hypothetical protein
MRGRHIARALVATAGGACLVLGCGDEGAAPSGRSMSAPVEVQQQAAADGPNTAPVLSSVSLAPSDPLPGQTLVAHAAVSDPDGDATQLGYRWKVDGALVTDATGPRLQLGDVAKDTLVEVEVIASDGRAESEARSATSRVGNRPPVISNIRLDPGDGFRAGETIVAVVDAADPDGDPIELSHQWFVNGQAVERDGTEPRFDTKGLERGDLVAVQVVAEDEDDESDPVTTPSLRVGNTAPEITSLPPAGVSEDGVYAYAVEAKDADGDRSLRYALATAPEGARIDPLLGELRWTPSFAQAGTHAIEVVVSDGQGGETKQRFEVTVRAVTETAEAPPAAPAP